MKGAILGIDLGKNVCSVAGMDEDGQSPSIAKTRTGRYGRMVSAAS